MKNRNCPNKDACWDYDANNCEGCAVGQKIEKHVRKIKRLQAENAALQTRLDNAVELPCVKIVKTKEVIDRVEIGDTIWEWAVVYIDKEGYFVVEPCASRYAAEARLAELKGE